MNVANFFVKNIDNFSSSPARIQAPSLLGPKLDHEHMKKAQTILVDNIHTYWDYPLRQGADRS